VSLINDVLRDLDKRQTAAPTARQQEPAPAAPRAGRPAGRTLTVAVVLVALAVPLGWWLLPGTEQPASTAAPPQTRSLDRPAAEAPAQPTPEPKVLAAVQDSSAPDGAGSRVSPAPPPAPAGTDNTADPAASAPGAAAEPAREAHQAQAAPPEAPSPVSPPDLPVLARAAPQIPAQAPAPAEPAAASAAEPMPRETGDSRISIRRADRPGNQPDPFAEARRALGRGQQRLAEDRLRGLLADQPDHLEARHLLATVLASSGRGPAAVRLLEEGLQQHSAPTLAGLLGRLLAESGETARALSVLETHAPDIDRAPDYHLLHAALLRQAGDHAAARDRYLAITRATPTSAAAWMGLAASHEALGETDAARAAYQQTLRHDRAELAAFARSRLRVLN